MQSTGVACLFLFSLLALVHIGSGYECYACAGADTEKPIEIPFPQLTITKGCANPVDTSKIYARQECSSADEACTKLEVEINGVEMVARACYPKTFCDGKERCYQCESDLCNTSSNILPSIILISTVSLIFAKLLT